MTEMTKERIDEDAQRLLHAFVETVSDHGYSVIVSVRAKQVRTLHYSATVEHRADLIEDLAESDEVKDTLWNSKWRTLVNMFFACALGNLLGALLGKLAEWTN